MTLWFCHRLTQLSLWSWVPLGGAGSLTSVGWTGEHSCLFPVSEDISWEGEHFELGSSSARTKLLLMITCPCPTTCNVQVHNPHDLRCWPSHLLGTMGLITEGEALTEGCCRLAEPCLCFSCCQVGLVICGATKHQVPINWAHPQQHLMCLENHCCPLSRVHSGRVGLWYSKSFLLFPRQHCFFDGLLTSHSFWPHMRISTEFVLFVWDFMVYVFSHICLLSGLDPSLSVP